MEQLRLERVREKNSRERRGMEMAATTQQNIV